MFLFPPKDFRQALLLFFIYFFIAILMDFARDDANGSRRRFPPHCSPLVLYTYNAVIHSRILISFSYSPLPFIHIRSGQVKTYRTIEPPTPNTTFGFSIVEKMSRRFVIHRSRRGVNVRKLELIYITATLLNSRARIWTT